MKKFTKILSVGVIGLFSIITQTEAQRFRVETPASIMGEKTFDFAENTATSTPLWGNVTITQTYLNVPVALVNDGSSNPYSGCNALVNTSLAGKAALIYRGGCEFGKKAKNAQDKGATFVIIVNNDPLGVVGMGAGTDGPNVNIPVLMVGKADGDAIKAAVLAGGCNVSLSPWGWGHNYDVALSKFETMNPLMPTIDETVLADANDRGQFYLSRAYRGAMYDNLSIKNIDTMYVRNRMLQGNVVKLGDSTLYLDTMIAPTSANVNAGLTPDSTGFGLWFTSGVMDLSTLPKGDYLYETYVDVANGEGDGDLRNNTSSINYRVTSNLLSRSQTNTNNLSKIDATFSPVNVSVDWGPIFDFPLSHNRKMLKVNVPIFIRKNSGVDDLNGRTFTINVFKWNDLDNDKRISGTTAATEFSTQVGTGEITFGPGSYVDTVNSRCRFTDIFLIDAVTGDSGIKIEDSSVYWFAMKIDGTTDMGVGMDSYSPTNLYVFNGTGSEGNYGNLWPYLLNSSNSFFSGYANLGKPSLALTISDVPTGINHVNSNIKINTYPNPAVENATLSVLLDKNAEYITYEMTDITGKVISTETVKNQSQANFKIPSATLAAGTYLIKVTTPEGINNTKLIKK